MVIADLLAAASPNDVHSTIEAVGKMLQRVADPQGALDRPHDLFGRGCNDPRAYRAGYARASRVRQVYGISASEPIEDIQATIIAALSVEAEFQWRSIQVETVDGVVQASKHPVFVGVGRRIRARRFHLARAFHHVLYSTDAASPRRLITRSGDWQQACSRSFAAEILAPAQAISNRLKGCSTSAWTEATKLTKAFNVDAPVILHQISNHGLN